MTNILIYISSAISDSRFWVMPLLLFCEIVILFEIIRKDFKDDNI